MRVVHSYEVSRAAHMPGAWCWAGGPVVVSGKCTQVSAEGTELGPCLPSLVCPVLLGAGRELHPGLL